MKDSLKLDKYVNVMTGAYTWMKYQLHTQTWTFN